MLLELIQIHSDLCEPLLSVDIVTYYMWMIGLGILTFTSYKPRLLSLIFIKTGLANIW